MEYHSARETDKKGDTISYLNIPIKSQQLLQSSAHQKYEEEIEVIKKLKIDGAHMDDEDIIMMSEPSTAAENPVERLFKEFGRDIKLPLERMESKLR